ncbi:MAG: O-antigen ligase family protein [Patescibacteria group bacterium]
MSSHLSKYIAYFYYLLFFFVPLVLFPQTSELFEFNKIVLTYVLTLLIVSSWIVKMVIERKIIFRRTLLDIPLLIFLASQLLSTITSTDLRTSLLGYYSRFHGGLLSSISYSLLYWAYASNMDKKGTLKAIFISGASAILVSIYAVAQHLGIDSEVWVQDVKNRVFSSLGQPNWLAAWLVVLMPLTWAFSLSSKLPPGRRPSRVGDKTQNSKLLYLFNNFWTWAGLSSLFFLVLLYTKSRSGLLGLGVAWVIFWTTVSWQKRKELKKFVKTFLIVNTALLLILAWEGSLWTPSLQELINKSKSNAQSQMSQVAEPVGPALEVGGSESGDIRRIVWSGATDIWKNYPILGTGVETFAFSYYNFRPAEHNLVSEWEYLYNKAHNEYLNYAATTGTVGLIAYLILPVVFFYWSFRIITNVKYPINTNDKLEIESWKLVLIGLISGYASILVTNFFGFSVVPVALQFFLYPAMASVLASSKLPGLAKRSGAGKNQEPPASPSEAGYRLEPGEAGRARINILSTGQKIGVGLTIILASYFLILISRYWYADYLYAKGKLENDSENYTQARQTLIRAIDLSSREAIFWDELSQSSTKIAQILSEEGDDKRAQQFARSAISESGRAVKLSSINVNLRRNRASMFIKLSAIDQNYLALARDTLLEATELAPTDAKLFYNLALSYLRTGEYQKSIEILEQTIEMKKNYRDAWFALALVHIDEGEIEKARSELEYILTNIGPDDPLARKELDELNSLYPPK